MGGHQENNPISGHNGLKKDQNGQNHKNGANFSFATTQKWLT